MVMICHTVLLPICLPPGSISVVCLCLDRGAKTLRHKNIADFDTEKTGWKRKHYSTHDVIVADEVLASVETVPFGKRLGCDRGFMTAAIRASRQRRQSGNGSGNISSPGRERWWFLHDSDSAASSSTLTYVA